MLVPEKQFRWLMASPVVFKEIANVILQASITGKGAGLEFFLVHIGFLFEIYIR